jgi:chemosensory pili system protein ChpA (sensor histidine kinase/response regulator)
MEKKMNIPTKESISFNLFYLMEFFNITLSKTEGKIAESHYNLLKDLCGFLLKEDTIVEGLEYIARYQTTNDLAIFLFDMIERVNEYGPFVIMNTLPDLADDFQNLYALLIEDDDNVAALQNVVAEFREKYGEQEKEKQLEEFVDMVKSDDGSSSDAGPELPFREFYLQELLNHLNVELKNNKNSENIFNVAELFLKFTADPDTSYSNEVNKVLKVVTEIYPDEKTSPSSLMNKIAANAGKLLNAIEKLEKNSSDQFNDILKSQEIKASQIEEKVEAVKSVETKDKSNLDSLLIEYFKTEVEDTVEDFKKFINKTTGRLNEPEIIDSFVKRFKNLKEVSMIHGYGGLEHLSNILVQQFSDLNKSKKTIEKQSIDILYSIFDELVTVEKFVEKDQSKKQVELVKLKINELVESFGEASRVRAAVHEAEEKIDSAVKETVAEEIKEEKPEEPETSDIEQPKEETVDIVEEIGVKDRSKFVEVVGEFISLLVPKILDHHKNIKEQVSQDFISYVLNILELNGNLFHPELNSKITEPLKKQYSDLFVSESPQEGLKILEKVWNTLKGKNLDEADLSELSKEIAALSSQEENFAVSDVKVLEAFLESGTKKWQQVKEAFLKTLADGVQSAEVAAFINTLNTNLKLLKLSNYYPFTALLKDAVDKSAENPLGNTIAAEFDSAFNLFFDRIRLHGKEGECNDIITALNDTISESITTEEEKEAEEVAEDIAQKTELPEETVPQETEDEVEDDLSLFRDETKEYLKTIDTNLKEFQNSRARKHLVEIETALHSVRSAAHYLNLQDISKLAATIEEAAELFGKSDLPMPDNLDKDLRIGVQTLENLISNPETEFSATLDMMESLIDHIVIEDMDSEPSEDIDVKLPEPEGISNDSKIEEKPLFAGGQDEDVELLEIFKDESSSFVKNIQFHNNKLLDDPTNAGEAKEMGYAAHSLKSAAKMLGFREISQITDGLEQVTESISSGEIEHSKVLHDTIEKAVGYLKELSEGRDVDSADISQIVNELEPSKWKEGNEEDEAEEQDEEIPENMVQVFVDEARELIEGLNNDYLELEKMPESEMILSSVSRRMHTLKGSAYISKYNLIGDLAHKLEDFIQLYIEKDSDIKNEMLDSFFVSLDLISEIVESIAQTGKEKIADFTARLAEVDNKMFLFQNFADNKAAAQQESAITTEPVKAASKKGEDESIIKISTEYMDKLVDMASELMINQTQLATHLHSLKEILSEIEGEKKQIRGAENILEDAIEFGVLKNQDKDGDDTKKSEEVKKVADNIKDVVRAVNMIHSDLNALTEGFEQNISRISSLSKLLHSDMLKTRMVPVDQLFNRYPRAVRDIAHKQNKKVNLVIEDNNTEMDRAMVEGLSEPLLHLIRNAIDHGIEMPAERKQQNKSETGTLILKAHQEKNQIVINVEDDGRGIEIDTIRTKIVEKGIAEKSQVEKMSEAEILDYIFYPGFTTKEEVTDTSGRGIGLDAVANQLQKLKGNIRIKTEKNVGTSFNIRVPLTLIVSQALMVKVNLQSIAIPVIAVQESVQYKKQEIVTDNKKQYIRVRGRLLPFMLLRDILKFNEGDQFGDEKPVQLAVVIHDAGVSMALGIDELVGRQEVVIKSLGSHLQNVDYISGGTILANGDVALILDYSLVIRKIEMHFFGKVSERSSAKITQKEEKVEKEPEIKEETLTEPKPKVKTESQIEEKQEKPAYKKEKPSPVKAIKQKTITDRKPKIIVVDDSNSVRNFVGSILERSGFIAIKSTNGADALDKMKSEQVDLIITDLEMPKMHGFDFISNIRGLKKYDDLPIIILTGRAGMKHRQTGEELGANAFIVKPFKEKDLLQSLAKFIKTENFG